MSRPTTMTTESVATTCCARCKRAFPPDGLYQLPRLPLQILSFTHIHVGAETDRLYCLRCRQTLSHCLYFLAVVGVYGTAIAILLTVFGH